MLHAQGTVLTTEYAETGTRVRALVTTEIQSQFAPFLALPVVAS
jgi:GTP-binding protein HflX